MNIKSVQRLKDQGTNGSPEYEFSTKIAPKKCEDMSASSANEIGTVIVGNTARRVSEWCNPSKAPPPNVYYL